MEISSVTIGLPVSDLQRSLPWYRDVFAFTEPLLEPAEGIVEFQVGAVWLQLSQELTGQEPTARDGAQVVTRFGVADAAGEHARLSNAGANLSPLEHVEGAVEYFDFTDPDGNQLSFYSILSA